MVDSSSSAGLLLSHRRRLGGTLWLRCGAACSIRLLASGLWHFSSGTTSPLGLRDGPGPVRVEVGGSRTFSIVSGELAIYLLCDLGPAALPPYVSVHCKDAGSSASGVDPSE